MDIYKLYVNFNEGTRDYVGATLYHNDRKVVKLSDIAKPEDVKDYTIKWRNGLIAFYLDMVKKELPAGAKVVTI